MAPDAPDTGSQSPSASALGKVLIIGAGPAGLTAAHLLHQRGVEVEVLEAASTHGGRTRHDLDFADFPIPLGAEWVHVDGSILDEIVNDPAVTIATELVPYQASDHVAYLIDGTTTLAPLRPGPLDGDMKFRSSSWLDFFDTYVTPGIRHTIRYNTQIATVDHSTDHVVLTDANGDTHTADRVVVTVPLRLLQQRAITFEPPLEPERQRAIDNATVWSGLKAFFEFDERFYPAVIAFADSETESGERLFYDAAYGQDTNRNIMGVFAVGAQAQAYQVLSEADFVARVLAELDAGFNGAASRTYIRHLVHNWDDQPFAAGAYLEEDADPATTAQLAQPYGDLVHFAGDAYTWSGDGNSVHTAARSAAAIVRNLLNE